MRSYEEIRQNAGSNATGFPVFLEHLARQKQGRVRNGLMFQPGLDYERIQVFFRIVTDRQFGVDNIVDEQRTDQRSCLQLRDWPLREIRIVGHQIE